MGDSIIVVRSRIILFLAALLALAAAARADVLATRDGKTYSAQVDSFRLHDGQGVFHVRAVENRVPSGAAHPVWWDHVASVEFRDLGDTGAAPRGRLASGTMIDGRVFSDVPVERAVAQDGNLIFHTRAPGSPPGGPTFAVPMTSIAELRFGALAAAPTPTRTPVDWDREPEMEFSMMVADPRLLAPDAPAQSDDGRRRPASDGDITDPFLAAASAPVDTNTLGKRLNLPRFLSAHYVLPGLGMAVDVLTMLVFLLLGTAVGGTFLYMSSRVEGIGDFPMWKAYVTGAVISLALPVTFRLVAMIPIFGPVLGLFAMYFVARAIVMGAMEVLEDKANSVIFTLLLLEAGTLILLIVVLSKVM